MSIYLINLLLFISTREDVHICMNTEIQIEIKIKIG